MTTPPLVQYDTPLIGEFWNEYRFLSNFYMSPITWQGKVWPSVEHAYQAAKSTDPDVQEQIRNLPTPGAAKRAGKAVKLRGNWEEVKLRVMLELVLLKFTQSPALADKLLATGNAILVEGNTWGDRYWGVCPPHTSNGSNYLGMILMEVRDRLKVLCSNPNPHPCYTGIGSRRTPPEALEQMVYFGRLAATAGWTLRSGAADGADSAFELGCNLEVGRKEIFLPWAGFMGHTGAYESAPPEAFQIAATIHPKWSTLMPSVKALHARNTQQVLGRELNSPSQFVICWTPDGCESYSTRSIRTGGTGTAIYLASKRGIPVYNIFNPGRLEDAVQHLTNQ